jgi:hypothetical protein
LLACISQSSRGCPTGFRQATLRQASVREVQVCDREEKSQAPFFGFLDHILSQSRRLLVMPVVTGELCVYHPASHDHPAVLNGFGQALRAGQSRLSILQHPTINRNESTIEKRFGLLASLTQLFGQPTCPVQGVLCRIQMTKGSADQSMV